MTQLTCKCGALYEVIGTQGPSRDHDSPLKCVSCGKDMFVWSGSNVGQLRLVNRPERDRE